MKRQADHIPWLLFVLLPAITLLLFGCDMCGNDVVMETKSPNGKLKAVIFERNCGATTGFSTQVSVIPSNSDLPSERGNVFSADDNHHTVDVGGKGTMDVKLIWESDNSLRIIYPKNARVFQRSASETGVSISYETAP
jgi:hypothetical protein